MTKKIKLYRLIKILILIVLFGLILNGVALLITKQNIIDLAKYWIASVVQMSLTINPPTVPPTPSGAAPIIPGPVVEEVPVEEIPEEVVSEEKIVLEEEIPEEILPEKIAEAPEVVEMPEIIKAPEIPKVVSKEVVAEWPTRETVDVVTGISGLVSWSISVLAPIVPAAPELPQTIDETPTFKGVSSIRYALISLKLSSNPVTGETQADENGFWIWTCPKSLSLGIHTLNITAQDPEDPSIKITSSQKFEIVAEEYVKTQEKTLFDVSLTIESKYKKVYPGDDLLVLVEIIKFEPKGRIDIPLHYQIRDEKDVAILDYTETMAIETRLSFLKTFHITEEAKLGKYKIYLEVPHNNTFISSSDSFEIAKRPLFVTPGVITLTAKEILGGLGLIFGIFLIGFITFVIFLYREFMLTKGIRKITPADLGDGALTRRTEELLREAQKILEESKKS